jgi:uncharacterized protein
MERVEAPSPATQSEWIRFGPSTIHGTGAFARLEIALGTRLIEYVGQRIDKAQSMQQCQANNEYIFSLNEQEDLDGNVEWNPARFINHSCEPNCDAELVEGRIWIVARRDIRAGEEITFNYGFDLEDYRNYPCNCGAQECAGFMVAEEFFDHVRRQSALASPSR